MSPQHHFLSYSETKKRSGAGIGAEGSALVSAGSQATARSGEAVKGCEQWLLVPCDLCREVADCRGDGKLLSRLQ